MSYSRPLTYILLWFTFCMLLGPLGQLAFLWSTPTIIWLAWVSDRRLP